MQYSRHRSGRNKTATIQTDKHAEPHRLLELETYLLVVNDRKLSLSETLASDRTIPKLTSCDNKVMEAEQTAAARGEY